MEKIYISERDEAVWDQLETKLKVLYVDSSKYLAIINFVACEENIDLRKIQELVAKYPSVDFRLYFNYNFTQLQENQWEEEAYSKCNVQRQTITDLGEDAYKHINKAYFIFEFSNTKSGNALKTLKNIRNMPTGRYSKIIVNYDGYFFDFMNNKRIDWVEAWIFISDTQKLNNSFSKYKLNICLTNENDVTNLRYFLPLWHKYQDCTIDVMGDKERIEQFFQMLDVELSGKVVINGVPFKSKSDIEASDILPMLCFQEQELADETDKYLVLIETYFAYLLNLKNVKNNIIREALLNYILKMIGLDILRIDPVKIIKVYAVRNLLSYLKNPQTANSENVKNYGKLGERQIKENDLDHFIDDKIAEKSLSFLINHFEVEYKNIRNLSGFNLFYEYLKKTNKFTLLIFLFLLRNLVKNEMIFTTQDKNKIDLDFGIIDKTWINSKTYAEGLLQLIENSLMHSEGHVAYFGMRIYKADPHAAMGTLADEAQTRTILYKTYWKEFKKIREDSDECKGKDEKRLIIRKELKRINANNANNIFNLGHNESKGVVYTDFIEFYVLDDAIGYDWITRGIVDVIKTNDTLKDDIEIKSIEDIFNLTQGQYKDSLKFYIQHYGMRWLKSHIDNLNGIMEIYSPCSVDKNDGKACCYSNIFTNLEIAVSYYNELYSSEYSILVPLEY